MREEKRMSRLRFSLLFIAVLFVTGLANAQCLFCQNNGFPPPYIGRCTPVPGYPYCTDSCCWAFPGDYCPIPDIIWDCYDGTAAFSFEQTAIPLTTVRAAAARAADRGYFAGPRLMQQQGAKFFRPPRRCPNRT